MRRKNLIQSSKIQILPGYFWIYSKFYCLFQIYDLSLEHRKRFGFHFFTFIYLPSLEFAPAIAASISISKTTTPITKLWIQDLADKEGGNVFQIYIYMYVLHGRSFNSSYRLRTSEHLVCIGLFMSLKPLFIETKMSLKHSTQLSSLGEDKGKKYVRSFTVSKLNNKVNIYCVWLELSGQQVLHRPNWGQSVTKHQTALTTDKCHDITSSKMHTGLLSLLNFLLALLNSSRYFYISQISPSQLHFLESILHLS